MRKLIILFFLFLVLAIIAQTRALDAASRRKITIAVVKDGASPQDAIVDLIEKELKKDNIIDIQFKSTDAFNAQWDSNQVNKVLKNALNDPQVDIVLLVGAATTQEAARMDLELTKPVISSFVQISDVFNPPYSKDGRSLKENFNFILTPHRGVRDIQTFKEMIPFKSVHIAVGEHDQQLLNYLQEVLKKYEQSVGVKLILMSISSNISEDLAKVEEKIEAVYLTRFPRFTTEQRKELIQQLTLKQIPTFSSIGFSDVKAGALAGQIPDMTSLIVRRLASNINQLIDKRDTKDLPVILFIDSQLLINSRTASLLGYSPDQRTWISAHFLHEEELKRKAKPLGFREVLIKAEEGNVALSVKDANVETSKQDKNVARTALFPRVATGSFYEYWDAVPMRSSFGEATISQIIFDDNVMSKFRFSRRVFNSKKYEREIARLDTLASAGSAFLQLVLARDLYQIEADNVRLIEDNLELAKLRYDLGYSGEDEVLRWESELAQRRRALFDRGADIELSRIALNQILGVDQNSDWEPQEVLVDPHQFAFLGGRVRAIGEDQKFLEQFREYAVELAFKNAPTIRALDQLIEAQKIKIGQLKRKFILPTLTADLNYGYELGSSEERLPGVRRDDYTVVVKASYPLFSGGRKYYDIKKAQADLKTLERKQVLAKELIEKRVRTAMRKLESSFRSIKFSYEAVKTARSNLKIVQSKYSQGSVRITDFLEAKDQNFSAHEEAVITIHSFFIDLVEFQRSISWFEEDKTADEKEELIKQIQNNLAKNKGHK